MDKLDLNYFVQAIKEYIDPTMLIVMVALWFVGYGLKQTPKVPNWSILWLLLLIGIILGLLIVGPNVHGGIQGVLAAALAIFGHQGFKQAKRGIEEATDDEAG